MIKTDDCRIFMNLKFITTSIFRLTAAITTTGASYNNFSSNIYARTAARCNISSYCSYSSNKATITLVKKLRI